MAQLVKPQLILVSYQKNKRKRNFLVQVPGRDKLLSYQAYLIGQLGRSDKYTTDDICGS